MGQLPELREGTPVAQPEATPVRTRKVKRLTVLQAWDDIGPVHAGPALPKALEDQRKGLAEGWTWRLTCGQGVRMVAVPKERTECGASLEDGTPTGVECTCAEQERSTRKTTDVAVPVASISLRCAHPDGRRAEAIWTWRSDTDKWEFSGPAYAWMKGSAAAPYQCDASEWRDLVRWVPELEAAA